MDTIVEVKHKKTGRPRTRGDKEYYARRRAYLKGKDMPGNSDNIHERHARNRAIRDEVLGTVCAITGETENLEVHHLCPSDATERSRKILDQYSSYGPDTIAEELRKCVLINRTKHAEIHRRVEAIMKEIKELTDLTPGAEKALKDYHTHDETERAIRIGQFLQSLEKDD